MPDIDRPPSKSERKRAHQRIQQLASDLARLSATEIDALPIAETAREELNLARRMPPSGARVRQLRHLAQLLESEDTDALISWLVRRDEPRQQERARHLELERIRECLIVEGPDAELQLTRDHPAVPAGQLRALSAEARDERERGKPRGAGRALFRFLAYRL